MKMRMVIYMTKEQSQSQLEQDACEEVTPIFLWEKLLSRLSQIRLNLGRHTMPVPVVDFAGR